MNFPGTTLLFFLLYVTNPPLYLLLWALRRFFNLCINALACRDGRDGQQEPSSIPPPHGSRENLLHPPLHDPPPHGPHPRECRLQRYFLRQHSPQHRHANPVPRFSVPFLPAPLQLG